ncbi:MAG TPA: TIGR02647 family protein [Gammaproteobacteria bacterium]
MSYTQDNLAELNVLLRFNLATSLEGIKIHHTADPAVIAAAKRLHERGFITLVDGGYLTPFGSQAVEHVKTLHAMLNAHSKV